MKITLNLATRPYADQGPAIKRLRIGMAALAVVLAALGFGLMHFHQAALRMAAQEDGVNRSIARVQQEQEGYRAQMQQPANARVLQQAEFLNGLFDEKSFSWTGAMEDLEQVLPAGVQVTAIEPARGKDGRLTLRLKVSGQRERSVEMVRNMEHSRRFVSPRIAGENSESSSQGDLQPVRETGRVSFDILAEYNPATLEERKAEIAAQKHRHPGTASESATPLPLPARPATRMPYAGQPPQPSQTLPGHTISDPAQQPGMRPRRRGAGVQNAAPQPPQGGPQ
ncbi:fimbrial assembly protein [Acidicapsa acidisoli]|uniref:fimbrial assembly protein n=1 Tax=Acidicapsa acidisoli TaxID=1615681 RepID=UPI0021E0541D|nr:fimbrial assembly protein [Acidicapsa acidisoli]